VLVALIFYPSAQLPPYVVFKAKGAKVPALCRKFRALKIPIVSLPSVALDFYRMAPPGQYLPPRSAPGMEKIMGMITPKA
jgi:type III secretory pathway component EscU